jgi:putative heme-binding domain-containing protein
MNFKFAALALFHFAMAPIVHAAEVWSDEHLPVKQNLELWLDASRENAARESANLPKIAHNGPVDFWHDGSGHGRHLSQRVLEARPRFKLQSNAAVINFDGKDDFLSVLNLRQVLTNATVVIFAAPRSNPGFFRAFFAINQSGGNDFTTGLTIDMGPAGGGRFDALNPEGSGFGGAVDLLKNVSDFGSFHTITVTTEAGAGGTKLYLDGVAQGQRDRKLSTFWMDEITVGARCYSNTLEPPHAQGFLDGQITEVIVYSAVLADTERVQVEKYLATKYAALTTGVSDESLGALRPLIAVSNPPPVQMLVPGFVVRELPVDLSNINNVKYRADGKLVALGYNGRVYLLSDNDGDGLEETVALFWDKETLRAPIGMALTPPGFARGQGIFAPAKGKLALIVDTNHDDVADEEIIVADGWKELPHGVDALGVALDREGDIYFGLGTANFTDAYLRDSKTGQARYDLKNERGTILKVWPDFQKREIICTGIRFPVALAFTRSGDLFCTDQEGATWLPNGNPLDELLHIQQGRHYGFPPRHPRHLPDVIDEPSVFDYAPQHQSTCGLNFNEPVNGGPVFGPAWWTGDALVTGYSRGKLYRTKLLKTSAGYVAQNQLIACLNMLPADACVSPKGDLVVAVHSGKPDWGSGPNVQGKLYKISYMNPEASQPVFAWAAAPTELRIAFDRPLEQSQLKNLTKQISITRGKYAAAGDRFESLRPGYQVVQDQLAEPRYEVPILSANVTRDRKTIVLTTTPQTMAVNYAVTLPRFEAPQPAAKAKKQLPQEPAMDLAFDLTGVEARWIDKDGATRWSGWLPHVDLLVARELTKQSSEHEPLWPLVETPGTLIVRGQFDLAQMLQPAVQPGSKLDYEQPDEEVFLRFTSEAGSTAVLGTNVQVRSARDGAAHLTTLSLRPPKDRLIPFELKFITRTGWQDWKVHWWTATDPRPRALPLRRTFLPWAAPKPQKLPEATERQIPELAGGNWLRGKRIFFGDQVGCHKCHQVRGEGGKIGADLSNLIHRDYASVLRDILFPNATINPDHIAYQVELKNGEAFTGVLQSDSRDRVVLGDVTGKSVTLSKNEIASLKPSALSLMPEGLVQALAPQQLKDLLTFLLTSPLEPALLEIKGEPPPRPRADVDAILKKPASSPGELKPLHVVLAAGPKDHGPCEHDYPLWQKRWEKLFALADDVKVSTAFGWPKPEQFENADVIVFYSNNPGWSAERASDLDRFLNRGGGLVYLHYAVDGHQDVEELAQRIGLAWRGGASRFRHGALDLEFQSHPLAEGFHGASFIDESYWQLVGDEKNIQLLASGIEEGKSRPLFWTREQGQGRVFVSILGHYTWTFDDPFFRLLVLRGVAWSAHQPMDRLAELATVGARMGN